MTSPRRGRRDNGLDAPLWSPLQDVDPRVGEHLLDVLRDAGIAAYLEPATDVGPYTRTVFLPSPPSDRLFVDRARVREGRELVEQHGDEHVPEHARGPLPERLPARRDLDEDAEWARIVSAFEAENGRIAVDREPADLPPPTPHELSVLDLPEEHYEPPPPPPVGVPSPNSLYACLLLAVGALLVIAPGLVGLTLEVGLVLGVAAVVGGVWLLVSRMRETSAGDGDDGAVV
ncbi:hypothetical protein [Trujillonella endophytica]|uniref:DUF308 domain-containing protein n=1 Tax=Trujillonella endophytica TaxID=673521 RepID=A0A1H8VNE7_9ACTN|nr:hypothetical protein [Trujillella endophytica]SEP16793.1 hypothetical protein SAMN05660991_03653 [Trujillella endophytica]